MVSNLPNQAEVIQSFANRMSKALSMLYDDLKLADEEKVKFHYAVDFAELYALTYPLGHHVQPMKGESEYETFRREIVTLSFIFARTKHKVISEATSLILLPPYIEEMKYTLALIKYHVANVNFLLNLSRQAYEEAYSPYAFTGEVRSIVERYSNSKTKQSPNDDERKLLVKYIRENYGDLLTAVMSKYHNGAALLNRFLSDGTLQPVKHYFKKEYGTGPEWDSLSLDRLLQDSQINKGMSDYLPIISNFPTRKNKDVPNRMDAAACSILRSINENLSKTGDVLLFISHSEVMNKVINPIDVTTRKGNQRKIHGVRNLDYFWLYYSHCFKDGEADRKAMITKIKIELDCIEEFQKVGTSLDDVKKIMEECNNAALAASTDENIRSLLVEHQDNSTDIGIRFLSMISDDVNLQQALSTLGEKLQTYLQVLVKSIESAENLPKR